MTIGKYQFCKDEFWNYNSTWNSEVPKLTKCLAQVGLTLIPNLVIFLLLLLEIKFTLESKNKPIRFNRFNIIRFLICFIGLFCNLKVFFDYVYDYVFSSDDFIPHTLSDLTASASNVFLFVFLIIIFYYHKLKGVITSGVQFILSLIITITSGILFLDTLLYNESMYYDFEVNNIYRTFFCSFSLFALCFIVDDQSAIDAGLKPSQDNENLLNNVERNTDDDDTPEVSPSIYSSFISKITYGWFFTVVKKCSKREIELNEIYDLEDELKVDSAVESFNKVYYKEIDRIKYLNLKSPDKKIKFNSISLLKVIGKVYWKKILYFASLKTLADLNTFSLPLLLNLLIDFLNNINQPKWHGIFIVMGFIITSSLKILLTNINNMESYKVGMNAKSALSNLVFTKSIKLSPKAKKKRTTGEIINLFSNDSARLDNFAPFFIYIWSSPFQIVIGFYLLYRMLGLAAFAGAFVIIVVMLLQYVLNRYKDTYLSEEMEVNDKRVNLVNECLGGIKIIKLYGWESAFLDKITTERNKQSNLNKKIYYLEMVLNFIFYSFSPFVIFTSTMAIYMFVQHNDLTPQTVFVSLTIFGLLDYPIQELPELISYSISVKVSLKRLSRFFREEELEDYTTRDYDNEMALTISNKARFIYEPKNNEQSRENEEEDDSNEHENTVLNDSSDKAPFELKDIELEIKKGEFVAIIGQVGSGKSSLISAIIGDMHLVENDSGVKGKVNISEDQNICYVAQQAWIQHKSFKDNILFGKPFNKFQYNDVIRACALEPDLKQFEAGDETEIGEKGINLSGGQKQRVSIARACYSSLSTNNKNQIILLDDPLSAVDAHVGKHLCENVLNSKTGLLKNSTRILVTNQLNQLGNLNVDKIILLKDGKIELKCTYDKLMELEMKGELDKYNLRLGQNEKSEEILDDTNDNLNKKKQDEKLIDIKDENESTGNKTLVEEEKRQKGKVQLKNHLIYFKYFGYHLFLLALIFMISENLFQIISRVYLADWTDKNLNETHSDNETKKENLLKYMGITFIEMVSNIIANIFIVFGIIRTLKKFHKKLLESVLRSPMKFYDCTPIGRIINRFSKDIMTIDESLPITIRELSLLIIRLLASILIIIYKQPNTLLFYFGIFVIYYYIMIMYVETSRQLRRFESVTESPVFSHLSETINPVGISTIKAFGRTQEFSKILRDKMDVTNRCEWLQLSGNRWLKFFLNALTNIIILIVTSQFILNKDPNSAGSAGLLLSYALVLTDNLSFVIRFMGLFETNAISIERINEYINLESEDQWIKDNRPPLDWPKNGEIIFENYSTRYREGTKLVLKDLSFKVDKMEKIGVVGRTGAGKSTITLALFRIIEPSQGRIIIDDIDISKIGLHDLRSKLSIIPQDPVLFTGTIRFNLDPFDKYSDKEIYESLEHAHLKQFVNSLEHGIQHEISEGGDNLSVGQRQLICLARALLRKSKILVLDEATASVDFATDELVQKTIRSEFEDCTSITIAHRLNTILDSTKILVLDNGELDEYDKPNKLLNNTDSSFYKMAQKANII